MSPVRKSVVLASAAIVFLGLVGCNSDQKAAPAAKADHPAKAADHPAKADHPKAAPAPAAATPPK